MLALPGMLDGFLRTMRAVTPVVLATIVSAGCGSSFDGRVYQGNGFVMNVPPVPPTWQRVDVAHTALSFEEPEAGALVLVNGRCDRDGEDVPLKSLTQHLFIRFTEREGEKEQTVSFAGREALRTEITAKLDGVQRRFAVYVAKKDNCVYDFVYFAPAASFPTGVGAFDAWVTRFDIPPREDGP